MVPNPFAFPSRSRVPSHSTAGCSASCLPAARFDAADAAQMYIFLASSLAWLPALVALDHADDDHLHAVCSVEDGAAVYRVARPLIFRHDAQPLTLHVGCEAQMLICDGLGYACDVWAKVVVKRVWDEGFAVVTICAQQLDVMAETVMDYSGVRRLPALTCAVSEMPAKRQHAAHAPRPLLLFIALRSCPYGP